MKVRIKTAEKCALVDKYRLEGLSVNEALRKVHLGSASYYAAKALGTKPKTKDKPKFMDFKLPEVKEQDNVIVIVCKSTQLKSLIGSL